MAKKLGRGLGDLLGEVDGSYENALSDQSELATEVDIQAIRPNPMQPRKVFENTALQELSDSIQEHGLLQPILLCVDHERKQADEESYILIAGERRWRASVMAGFLSIKAIILRNIKPTQLRQIALIENIQREDLNPVEMAQCYKELIEEHNLTHEALAQKISKSRTQITNSLRILNLEKNILDAIASYKISQGHAKILVGLDENERKNIATLIMDRGLSVRETEDMIRSLKDQKITSNNKKKNQEDEVWCEEELRILIELLEKKGIKAKKYKNQLQLSFRSKESVKALVEILQ